MPRERDVPCAACGRLMWWNPRSSLPKGQSVCQPCRRKTPAYIERQAKKHTAAWDPKVLECPICQLVFTQDAHNQVYCSASCRESRRNWSYGTKAASAEERGYGKAHRETRAKWKPIVESGQANCCICGYWIEPGSKWHLDHTEDRTGYRGVAHAQCNVRDGASRGARRTNARRQIEKQCATCHAPFITPYPKQTYCSVECRPKAKAKPRPPRQQRYCVDCACSIRQGKRCRPCAQQAQRVLMRNKYRQRVGIPLDAPLYQSLRCSA